MVKSPLEKLPILAQKVAHAQILEHLDLLRNLNIFFLKQTDQRSVGLTHFFAPGFKTVSISRFFKKSVDKKWHKVAHA